jgi:hypothetical protein
MRLRAAAAAAGEGDGVRGEARGLGGKRTYISAMGASWPSDVLGFWNGGWRMAGVSGPRKLGFPRHICKWAPDMCNLNLFMFNNLGQDYLFTLGLHAYIH